MFDDDDSVVTAMRAGARGFVLKGADQYEIFTVIRAVANGEAHFGPAIARRLITFLSTSPPATAEIFPELTAREREVLDLIARVAATRRSLATSSSATRRCATTSRTSSPSSKWPTARRRSSAPETPASAAIQSEAFENDASGTA
jgi:FixJ family two-component response regulator